MSMWLNYLKPMAIFAVVVETGSFTAAGKRLNMPRGKVSEQVARLEDYLGVKLFIRSTRKVSITAEGEVLYKDASKLLAHGSGAIEEVKSLEDEVKGKIRITTTSDFYECLLLPILKRFKVDNPQVEFDLIITEEALPIIEDAIDIAIRSGDLPNSNLVAVPLTQTRLKLFASPTFNQAYIQHPNDLEGASWVALKNAAMSELMLSNTQGESICVSPNYKHSANNIHGYQQLIEADFGIGLMAEHSGLVLVNEKRFIAILPDWHLETLPVSLVFPSRMHMAKRTRLLIQVLRQAFAG